jgi:hypothetical protein
MSIVLSINTNDNKFQKNIFIIFAISFLKISLNVPK